MTLVKTITGPFNKQRLIIKKVSDPYKFINKQYDNNWSIYVGPLKAGTYAFVGGEWKDVKKIPSSILPHV